MLFWVTLLVLIIGIVVSILEIRWIINTDPLGIIITFTFGIIISIMLFVLIFSYITATSTRLAYEQRYSLLLDEASVLRELDNYSLTYTKFVVDIKEWNEEIVQYKALQRDFWIGIFIPNIYDGFDVIKGVIIF